MRRTARASGVQAARDHHAQQGRHNHVEIGFNWRMDGFQGAVLSIKLPRLDGWNARRRAIAARYLAALNGTPGEAASFDRLHALLDAQAYRLAFWRTAGRS